MLRPTHKRAGFTTGLIMSITFLSTFKSIHSLETISTILLAILLIISGNYLGAEWPDIDSKNSIPRKEHPIWGHIFDIFGIKHRGPVSHSVLSLTIIWLVPAFVIKFFGSEIILNADKQMRTFMIAIINVILAASLGRIISILFGSIQPLLSAKNKSPHGVLNALLFLMTDDRLFSKQAGIRKINDQKLREVYIISFIGSIIFFFATNPITNATNNSIKDALSMLFIYLVAIYIGCLSHLWMDVSTLDGVYIDWTHKVSPAKWMMNTPVLNMFVPNNQFRTGSSWETIVRIIISIINIIAFMFLIYVFLMKV